MHVKETILYRISTKLLKPLWVEWNIPLTALWNQSVNWSKLIKIGNTGTITYYTRFSEKILKPDEGGHFHYSVSELHS
jgi:hypothetical protein